MRAACDAPQKAVLLQKMMGLPLPPVTGLNVPVYRTSLELPLQLFSLRFRATSPLDSPPRSLRMAIAA